MKTLKERIKEAFPNMTDSEFDRHETDLYVKHSGELYIWLQMNYEYFANVSTFRSQIDGTTWFDIPFAAWSEKYPNSKFI